MNDFVDSSVILAAVLPFNSNNAQATTYLTAGDQQRHASWRVRAECLGIVRGLRQAVLQLLSLVAAGAPNAAAADRFVLDQAERVARSLEARRFKGGAIRQFATEFLDELRQIAIGAADSSGLSLRIASEVAEFENDVFLLFATTPGVRVLLHKRVPRDISARLPAQAACLSAVVHNDPDVRILLDAVFVSTTLVHAALRFVTFDRRDILDNKAAIEACAPQLSLFSP